MDGDVGAPDGHGLGDLVNPGLEADAASGRRQQADDEGKQRGLGTGGG